MPIWETAGKKSSRISILSINVDTIFGNTALNFHWAENKNITYYFCLLWQVKIKQQK